MNNLLRRQAAVRWLPWSRAAFDRARDEGKVVLLSLATAWSHACREMDARCYADGEIADAINTWFVPIRVDADRRPDIADRYELGGLPTIAFLNGDGEILGGGTFVEAERLMSALARLRQDARAVSTAEARLPTSTVTRRSELGVEELTALVFESFDAEHGGFGAAPKFPLPAPVRLALDLFQESPSKDLSLYVDRSVDAFGWSPLYDETGGGFFRCSARADWDEPQREKLLLNNAVLLDLLLDAGVAMHNQRWLDRAADTLEFVQSKLADAPGEGWRTSEESDRARLSDANARMASAAMHAARVFGDRSLGELALQSLESVLLASYRPGQGVAHCASGVRGLLTDQITMLNAQLDAWDLTGDIVYRMMAQELAHFAVRTMWHADSGAFLDRASSTDDDSLGLLAQPVEPFVLNCEAAEALHRLSRAAEEPEFDRIAGAALDAMHPRAPEQGPLAAHYVLARRAFGVRS